jgi:hypothetical protein
MHAIKFALFAAIACCTVPAIAQWQWIDGQGRKVFSDRAPPADIPAKNILRSPGGGQARSTFGGAQVRRAPTAQSMPRWCGQGLEEQKRNMKEQEAAKPRPTRQKEKQRQDNCNRARQAKATLASGRLLSM